jgi:hypothetical protein
MRGSFVDGVFNNRYRKQNHGAIFFVFFALAGLRLKFPLLNLSWSVTFYIHVTINVLKTKG